jgi:hypothetical protein
MCSARATSHCTQRGAAAATRAQNHVSWADQERCQSAYHRAREGFRHCIEGQRLGRHCGRARDEAFRKKRTISAEASGPAGSV